MQRLAGVLAMALCAACGDDGVQTPEDAVVDTTPAVRCDPTKPFGAPTFLTELASERAENGARLYDDERTIIFARRSLSTNLYDIFVATRASRDVPFDAPAPLTTVNSVSNDTWASQTPDGLTLIFDADRGAGSGQFRPWISRRTAPTAPFGPPAIIPELALGDMRTILANATALYFVSAARGGAGAGDLFRADVDASGTIGTPVALAGTVNTVEEEETPAVTTDERAIYFRRRTTIPDPVDPVNNPPTFEYDIWAATRGNTSEDFGPPALVENLSVAGSIETPSWISADGCVLYGSVEDANDAGDGDLVVAVRPL